MFRIGIDVMGGDYAPEAAVKGAILAHNELREKAELVLIGDKNQIYSICEKSGFDPYSFRNRTYQRSNWYGRTSCKGVFTKT